MTLVPFLMIFEYLDVFIPTRFLKPVRVVPVGTGLSVLVLFVVSGRSRSLSFVNYEVKWA